MNWATDFAGPPPIKLPDGRKLETLADCRAYILALPASEQRRWEMATKHLLQAAELGGPFRFIARVSFARALHGIDGAVPAPRDKRAAWKAKRATRNGDRESR